jgi:hypothetical protein
MSESDEYAPDWQSDSPGAFEFALLRDKVGKFAGQAGCRGVSYSVYPSETTCVSVGFILKHPSYAAS